MQTFYVTLGFIAFDVITGLFQALYTGTFNSSTMRKGLFHKGGEILTIVGAYLLQYAVQYIDLGITVPMVNAVAVYICLMELGSIIENLCKVNPTLYDLFKPFFDKLKQKDGESNA